MPKPKPPRESAFGEGEESPIPFIPARSVNDIYEKGAAGILPTSYMPSPEERRIVELEEQISGIMQQLEGRTSELAVQDGTLLVHGFQLTSTGLIPPESVSSDAWIDLGRLLAKLEGSLQWLIGDWIVYGETIRWGDIPALAKELGFSEQTLRDYSYVARNVQLSIRIDNLSFGHHQVVAPLTPEQQDFALRHAADNKLSVAKFRQWLREQLDTSPPLPIGEMDEALTVTHKLAKFFKHAPSTSAEKMKALEYIQEMRGHLHALEKKCR